ncbi:carbohydrate ABC transporter permease [Streptomyces sp. NPDC020917]|uniref:carbohydrate ABC transporter permease n=1 Tax=Streptomyces sp. NPDC020917 TaxID=3365102 RepID=UPI0037A93B70
MTATSGPGAGVLPHPPGALTAPSRTRRTLLRGLPLVPSVVLMLIFLAGPIAYCVYYAFTDMRLTGASATHFVGFGNFTKAFGDANFRNAVWLTLVFTVLSSIVGQNVLGLFLAALMRNASRAVRATASTVVVVSWVIPEVVAAYLLYAFFRREGELNTILRVLHLPQQNWLFTLPIVAVSVANVWRGTAFSMLVYSAALQEIPAEITEAAEVDGAGRWRKLWHVTLPMIRRSIGTNLMLNTLQTLSVFGLIFVMTRGGPGNRSETLPLYMYEQAFQDSLIGYGTAVALMLLVVGGLFSVLYLRLLRTEV